MKLLALMALMTGITWTVLNDPLAAQPIQQNRGNRNQESEQESPPLPDDERLLALHRNFVNEAKKLATEYERDREYDKAKAVYEEILKLVPQYQEARDRLNEINEREAFAEKEEITLRADEDWHDTEIIVEAGKPIRIATAGSWTIVIRAEMSGDGITIPEDYLEFPLGCLVGLIDTGVAEDAVPFVIGNDRSFVPEKSGRLHLRSWDLREWHGENKADNEGAIRVLIQGTFERAN